MRIAVLGGGFQGCCAAIELARRGAQVVLFDRNSALLAGAATANEGKIHLGYVYGADRSLATARTMLRGALSFAPLVHRYLDSDAPLAVSERFVYAVHRDSQLTVEDVAGHLAATHSLIAVAPGRNSYFGIDLRAAPRRLTQAALEQRFAPSHIAAAFDTPEIAVDCVAMAELMRSRVAQDRGIEVRTSRKVTGVEADGDRLRVRSAGVGSDGTESDTFDRVVNALWEGRLAVDATLGIHPGRKWIHRFKHGIQFRLRGAERLPSVTLVLGPFGDLVSFGNGRHYLSWYPACMLAHSEQREPPAWRPEPDDPLRSRIVTESFAAMGAIVPPLLRVFPQDIAVKGGVIVAWGSTDIDDRVSELHCRYEIGVHSHGRYHSIDTGKLTMAPHFAQVCANRILPKPRP